MVLAKDIETADYIAFAKNVTLPSHCFLNVQVTTKKLSSQEYHNSMTMITWQQTVCFR